MPNKCIYISTLIKTTPVNTSFGPTGAQNAEKREHVPRQNGGTSRHIIQEKTCVVHPQIYIYMCVKFDITQLASVPRHKKVLCTPAWSPALGTQG